MLARGVVEDFIEKGYVDFSGIELSSNPEEAAYQLATYAQILRNPKFETFRMFFTKGDTVVGTFAISSKLISTSLILEDKYTTVSLYIIYDRMKRLEADGYYMLHNHPSGYSKPSSEDIDITLRFFTFLKKNITETLSDIPSGKKRMTQPNNQPVYALLISSDKLFQFCLLCSFSFKTHFLPFSGQSL